MMTAQEIENSALAADCNCGTCQFCRADRAAFGGSRVLTKASFDTFFYAAGLQNGMTVYFQRAVAGDDWVTLHGVSKVEPPIGVPTGRGIEVRLSDIVWLVDSEG
jgi:hypothetical protein